MQVQMSVPPFCHLQGVVLTQDSSSVIQLSSRQVLDDRRVFLTHHAGIIQCLSNSIEHEWQWVKQYPTHDATG